MQQLTSLRVLAGIGAIVVAIAVVALLFPRFVSEQAIRAEIASKVRAIAGRDVTFAEDPQLRLTPLPTVIVRNLSISGPPQSPEKPALQISRLEADISLSALLGGKVQLTDFRLLRPKLRITVGADGSLTWPGGESTLLQNFRRAKAAREAAAPTEKVTFPDLDRLEIGQFAIVDGVIEIQSADGAPAESVTNITASFNWNTIADPASLSGTAIFRNESFTFSLQVASPIAFSAGAASRTDLKIACGAFNFAFSGEANMFSGLHASGAASLSSQSLRRILNFLKIPVEPGATFGEFAASGNLIATSSKFELQDASVSLDGNKGRGALVLAGSSNSRPQLNGTLAFSVLDLTPYWNAVRQELSNPAADLGAFEVLNLLESDLRISAPTGKLGPISVTDFAASIVLRNSELTFDVGTATLFGGTAMGKLSAVQRQGLVTLQARGSLAGFALADMLGALPAGGFRFSGKSEMTVESVTSGTSIAELRERFASEISIKGKAGTLAGIDFAAIVANAEKSKPGAAFPLGGSTEFKEFSGSIFLDRNHLWIASLRFDGPKAEANVNGRADYASGGLALQVSSMAKEAGGTKTKNIFIGGLFAKPLASSYPIYPE